MQDAYEFLNEKLRSEKREKNYFFCKLNIKDGNVFYTDIYTITTIKIFTCSYIKKSLKKCLRRFNKTFSNYQATYYKELYLLFENQSEHRDPSLPPVCFHSHFKDLPLPLHSKPFIKKGSLEEIKGINDNASAFMRLNIKANK